MVGAGGLGVVYEAVPLAGEGRFAVKLLRRELCAEPAVVARFLDEAQASARVDHPGVLRAIAHGRAEDGTPYLVMPLLEGESLSALMNRGPVAVPQATGIVLAILDALGAAHAAGVVHRDLKPDNVYLARTATGGQAVRLLDFGLARVVDAAGGLARRTRTGVLLGTPGYMSPEQMQNAKTADSRADLWSVGVMFFEMLAGSRAYSADNEFERMSKVLIEPPPVLSVIAPEYAHFDPFFARALAREPSRRFADAAEMSAAVTLTLTNGAAGNAAVPRPSAPAPAGKPLAQTVELAVATATTAPFGGVATAVSPGAGRASVATSTLDDSQAVRIVTLPPRGFSLAALLGVAGAAWLLGLGVGYLLGAR